MSSISEIRATGIDIYGNHVEWVVAVYLDSQEAFKHYTLCHSYLAKAHEALPATLSEKEKIQALASLNPAHDPQYAQKQAQGVTYFLDAQELHVKAPQEQEGNPWRAGTSTDGALVNLVEHTARRFMFDEEMEGAPAGPLPALELAQQRLWTIGIDPSLMALDSPTETSGQMYYRLLGQAVENRRQQLRERYAAQ